MNNNIKKVLKVILKVVLILIIVICLAVVSLAGTVFFTRWQKDVREKSSGDKNFIENLMVPEQKELEPKVTCLFLGINGNLTDFIMLGQYDPNTRNIALVSIPRDTNVGDNSVDGKINSVYSTNKNGISKIQSVVTDITGIDIDYYVLFKTRILREIVDEIGGVTVDVPINMNYDDPEQNLYIHLKKGVQTLNGSQAEQFVRFRKNNNGTGYSGGDIERTGAQQKFIKAFINDLLKVGNISKISNLINIVIDGTTTNATFDNVKDYIDDVLAIKTDRITTNTLPGTARMATSRLGYDTSYYFLDKAATKQMINEMFLDEANDSGETTEEVMTSDVAIKSSEAEVTVELLNAGASSSTVNKLVEELNNNGFYVEKIGKYDTTRKEESRIISYGTSNNDYLKKLQTVSKVTKVETISEKSSVDFTVMIGPYYDN